MHFRIKTFDVGIVVMCVCAHPCLCVCTCLCGCMCEGQRLLLGVFLSHSPYVSETGYITETGAPRIVLVSLGGLLVPGSLSLGLQAHTAVPGFAMASGHLDTGSMASTLLIELSQQPLLVALFWFCSLNICSIRINCVVLIL